MKTGLVILTLMVSLSVNALVSDFYGTYTSVQNPDSKCEGSLEITQIPESSLVSAGFDLTQKNGTNPTFDFQTSFQHINEGLQKSTSEMPEEGFLYRQIYKSNTYTPNDLTIVKETVTKLRRGLYPFPKVSKRNIILQLSQDHKQIKMTITGNRKKETRDCTFSRL